MTNPTDHEPRAAKVSWGLIIDTLDVFERHGFTQLDDAHTGRAIGYLRDVVRIYSGELDQPAGPSGATLPDLAGKISAFERAPRCVFCGFPGPLKEHGETGDLVCADDDACLARGYRQPGATR